MADPSNEAHPDPAAVCEGSVVLVMCCAVAVGLCGFALGYHPPTKSTDEVPAVSRPTGPTSPRMVRGRSGAVATAAPEASAAALEVLERGGNAFDALVSASFVLGVVRPHSSGIGGGGFAVLHDAESGRQIALDGREVAPDGAKPDMYVEYDREGNKVGVKQYDYRRGPRSAAVPGLVALLERIYAQHGSQKGVPEDRKAEGLSWSDLLEPAILLARDGFRINREIAAAIEREKDILLRYPDSRRIFCRSGRPLREGEWLRQTDLAKTLEDIATQGAAAFYRNAVCAALATATVPARGLITQKDLNDYLDHGVQEREVVRGTYRGMTVVSMSPPSSGGTHLVQMLNVLSGLNLDEIGRHEVDHLHLLAETMRRAFADRSRFMADPDFEDVPVAKLIDPGYAERIRGAIDMRRATPSAEVGPGALLAEGDQTSHISIVDAHGNAVASTQTINTLFGSGFVAGRTGVLLNNEMNDFTADPDEPNEFGLRQSALNLPARDKRPLSSMAPTIVLDGGGKVRFVIGSPGGPKIISTVLQILSNLVDFEMDPLEAVDAPRIHHQWSPDVLLAEKGIPGATALAHRGHTVLPGGALGNAQVVVVQPDGVRVAVSDRRGTGRPAAYSVVDEAEHHEEETGGGGGH